MKFGKETKKSWKNSTNSLVIKQIKEIFVLSYEKNKENLDPKEKSKNKKFEGS